MSVPEARRLVSGAVVSLVRAAASATARDVAPVSAYREHSPNGRHYPWDNSKIWTTLL